MERYKTSNPYEQKFGYSRAVKKGPFIFVSGTTSIDQKTGEILHPESAYKQALRIFEEIVLAVEELGGERGDIVRVRMFVAKDEDGEEVGRALKEALGKVEPAATMIIGAKLVSPKMLVEIEADAVIWYLLRFPLSISKGLIRLLQMTAFRGEILVYDSLVLRTGLLNLLEWKRMMDNCCLRRLKMRSYSGKPFDSETYSLLNYVFLGYITRQLDTIRRTKMSAG